MIGGRANSDQVMDIFAEFVWVAQEICCEKPSSKVSSILGWSCTWGKAVGLLL